MAATAALVLSSSASDKILLGTAALAVALLAFAVTLLSNELRARRDIKERATKAYTSIETLAPMSLLDEISASDAGAGWDPDKALRGEFRSAYRSLLSLSVDEVSVLGEKEQARLLTIAALFQNTEETRPPRPRFRR